MIRDARTLEGPAQHAVTGVRTQHLANAITQARGGAGHRHWRGSGTDGQVTGSA